MSIIHREFDQKSLEWLMARSGIPTASEFDQLLTPDFKVRTGEMPKTFLARKLAERWQGGPIAGYMSIDMEAGNILEDEAKPWYALEFGEEVESVGFITTDDKRVGCSPDGLLGEHGGIEIKCPAAHTQVGYVLNGGLPKDYACQVHGSMFVSGRPWWKFLSYRRHFPPLLITVERDDKIQAKIAEAVALFLEDFDSAMKRMEEINGAPAPKIVRHIPRREEFQPPAEDRYDDLV